MGAEMKELVAACREGAVLLRELGEQLRRLRIIDRMSNRKKRRERSRPKSDVDFVIVDGCSADEPPALVRMFEKADDRVPGIHTEIIFARGSIDDFSVREHEAPSLSIWRANDPGA